MDLLSKKAFTVLNENGCQYCHTSDSEMPFYASLPIAKQLMEKDVATGLRHFNMKPLLTQMQNNESISEVDLAKIESAMEDNAMPPNLYLTMHWGSKLSSDERQTLLAWVKAQRHKHYPEPVAERAFQNEVVQPISTTFTTNVDKVALGKTLYHDTRLSGDNTVSCASCHDLTMGGVDRLRTSTGVNNAQGPINAPTVFNAVFNTHQFWDGRAADLQAQAGGPPMNPIEMASGSWQQIIDKLAQDGALSQSFNHLYTDGITGDNITDAIAEFEKTLVTPNSRFDQYLKGNTKALTATEQEGYALFKTNKCTTCHVGEAMGGQSFEVMGLKKPDYFSNRGNYTDVDNGRFNATGDTNDLHRFKVPTLRNIALTAPYFHDGSAITLEDAVDKMALYQVGVQLSKSDINKITAYLHTLNGEYDGQLLK
ncbi:cytochrome-c peroxidase [Photobacterium frigidiphilum]|uniref:Cytochrome-c peroxidase n=2 Tax=Photobacterium frigidiphilum TaxID=264736 RepID=A0A2T3JAE1_9GAMM|nr:cytochrome-c peroxidase [Photobacterium frigidiphilum]